MSLIIVAIDHDLVVLAASVAPESASFQPANCITSTCRNQIKSCGRGKVWTKPEGTFSYGRFTVDVILRPGESL